MPAAVDFVDDPGTLPRAAWLRADVRQAKDVTPTRLPQTVGHDAIEAAPDEIAGPDRSEDANDRLRPYGYP